MMKLHITEKAVRDTAVPAGRKHILIFDSEQTGFAVQKTIAGSMSYVILYRNAHRQQRQEKLATVGKVSTKAARNLAAARLAVIGKQKKRRPRSITLTDPTMDDFFFKSFLPLTCPGFFDPR